MEVLGGVSGQLTPQDRKALIKRIVKAGLFVVACVALKLPFIAVIVFLYFLHLYRRHRPSTVDLLAMWLSVTPLMGPFATVELGGLLTIRFQWWFLVLLLVSVSKDKDRALRSFPANGLDRGILAFAVVCLVSIANSIMFRTPLRTLVDALVVPVGYYVVAKHCIRKPDCLPKLYLAAMMGILAFGSLGLYEAVTKKNLLDYGESELDVFRANGPMRMAEDYGVCMNMLLLFCLSMASLAKAKMVRGSRRYVTYLVGSLAVAFTLTRGIWLSLTTGSLMLLFRRRKALFFTTVAVVPTIAWLMFDLVVPHLSGDIWEKRVNNQKTVNARLATYKSALEMFQDHPILGVGFVAFGEVQERNPRYQTEYLGEPAVDTVHNLFLSILSETGLVGIAAAALVLIYVFRFSARVARSATIPLQRDFGEAVICITVAYLVAGLGNDFTHSIDFVNKYLFLFLGGISGLVDEISVREKPSRIRLP